MRMPLANGLPVRPLPEITLRAPAVIPPIVFAATLTQTPLKLPRRMVPVASVPMKLPWTKFPVAPEPKMSTPFRLPEITLAAAWVRAPDNVVGGGDPDTYSIAVVAQVGAAVDIRSL